MTLLSRKLKSILFVAISIFVCYGVVLTVIRHNIDWESRKASTVCLDPAYGYWNNSNIFSWGNTIYKGEWIKCNRPSPGDNYLCTAWGYTCVVDRKNCTPTSYNATCHGRSSDPLSDVCPFNYGGISDGCIKPPSSIINTIINMVIHPTKDIDYPMFESQMLVQQLILLCTIILIILILVFGDDDYSWYGSNNYDTHVYTDQFLDALESNCDDDVDDDSDNDNHKGVDGGEGQEEEEVEEQQEHHHHDQYKDGVFEMT